MSDMVDVADARDSSSSLPEQVLEEFECSLCMRLFFEPLTLACGHTFCRPCLQQSAEYRSSCALCREVFYIDVLTHPVSVSLVNVIKRCFPEQYAKRAEENEAERQELELVLPLFPLNTVAFPHCKFPMHIFEHRYRLMLKRVMQGHKQFGLVGIEPDASAEHGFKLSNIGCALKIEDCHTLPDERSIIDTVGTRRFEILEKWNKDGYLVGKVRWLADKMPRTEEELRQAGHLVHKLVSFVNNAKDHISVLAPILRMKKRKNFPVVDQTPESWSRFSYWLCELINVTDCEKNNLLREDSLTCLMERLVSLIEQSS